MEQVDEIIIITLRGLGCNLPEDCRTIREFSPEVIVEAVATCLNVVLRTDLPTALPSGMSGRVRMCNTLADECKNLGYKGELGYQTIMYGNEKEIRALFVWMNSKLPSKGNSGIGTGGGGGGGMEDEGGAGGNLQRAAATELAQVAKGTWMLPVCRPKLGRQRGGVRQQGARGVVPLQAWPLYTPARARGKQSEATKRYMAKYMPLVTQQPPTFQHVGASVLEENQVILTKQQEREDEWESKGIDSGMKAEEYWAAKEERVAEMMGDALRKGLISKLATTIETGNTASADIKSRFVHQAHMKEQTTAAAAKPPEDQTVTEAEKQEAREKEVEALRLELDETVKDLQRIQLSVEQFASEMRQMQDRFKMEVGRKKKLEEVYKAEKRVFDLLDDAEGNISRLQGEATAAKGRLVDLAMKWEAKRVPLVQKYRALQGGDNDKMDDSKAQLEEIKKLRELRKTMIDEAKEKDGQYQALVEEYKAADKSVTRAHYTARILDIVKQVKKQKVDINKILLDTRELQKEINTVTETLGRTWNVTDEMVFNDIKTNPDAKPVYKSLAALHQAFESVVTCKRETGEMENEIRELEGKMDALKQSPVALNLDSITADYEQVKEENAELVAKIKERMAGGDDNQAEDDAPPTPKGADPLNATSAPATTSTPATDPLSA